MNRTDMIDFITKHHQEQPIPFDDKCYTAFYEKFPDKEIEVIYNDTVYFRANDTKFNSKEATAIYNKKYREDNKEAIAIYIKKYNEDNNEEILKRKKEYHIKNNAIINEKFVCTCGGKYSRHNKKTHEGSKKHIKYINQ